MDELQKLLSLFEAIEPLHKKVEGIGKGLDGPALNETRNATFHLLKALCSPSAPEETKIQIEKAERHAQRAIYDCHEAVLLVELDKLRAFKMDYKDVVIGDVVVNYQEGMQDAECAKELIQSCRSNQKDRNNFYSEIAPLVQKISDFNKKCEISREELNKRIRKENKENKWIIWQQIFAVIGILGVIGTFCAWLLPRDK